MKRKRNSDPPSSANESAFAPSWCEWLFRAVPADSIVFFRIAFGATLLWVVAKWVGGAYQREMIAPVFHFSYPGFSWVKPLPPVGMWLVLAALGIAAVGIIIGYCYRICSVVCFLAFTYLFLLDRAYFLNHFYLICLLAFSMMFIPANRWWSLDAKLRPKIQTASVPAWALYWLRFQIGVPYFFGGIAKLNADWMRGQPMGIWLKESSLQHLFGPIIREPWMAMVFSWGGIAFDLGIVPLLLWKRTRVFAYCWMLVFHLLNALTFEIGVFPWAMIALTTIFFTPNWVSNFFAQQNLFAQQPDHTTTSDNTKKVPALKHSEANFSKHWRWVVLLLGVYCSSQLVLPFRHWLIPGHVDWTEEGYYFSWRMMLRTKRSGLQFVYYDAETGEREPIEIRQMLIPIQLEELGNNPEMMREFSVFLRERDSKNREVRVIALCTINGRKPQLLIDPKIDLSAESRSLWHQPWIVDLVEPFRTEPYDVPHSHWINEVDWKERPD